MSKREQITIRIKDIPALIVAHIILLLALNITLTENICTWIDKNILSIVIFKYKKGSGRE